MSSYLKEAWEMHISAGERVELFPSQHMPRKSIEGILRGLKSRSAAAFMSYGMIELAQSLSAKSLKFRNTETGILVWLEDKPTSTGTFRVITEEELK